MPLLLDYCGGEKLAGLEVSLSLSLLGISQKINIRYSNYRALSGILQGSKTKHHI